MKSFKFGPILNAPLFYSGAFRGYYAPTRQAGHGILFSIYNAIRLAGRIGK